MHKTARLALRRALVVVGTSGLLLVSGVGAKADATGDAPPRSHVYARDAVVFGQTLGDWAAAWWQWAASLPAQKHPLFDTAPCDAGQSGPVFFIGGRFCNTNEPSCPAGVANRTCRVPKGRAILVPLANVSCNSAEAEKRLCKFGDIDAGPVVTEMRQFVAAIIDETTGYALTLDGRRLPGPIKEANRVTSPLADMIVPTFPGKQQNLFQAIGEPVPPGRHFFVDDGVYVMLKPLPAGKHRLNFKAALPPFASFDVTYLLEVGD
jgi:hypothetical protein